MARRASAAAYQTLFGRKTTPDLQVVRSTSVPPGKAVLLINENDDVPQREEKGGLMGTLGKFLLFTSLSENVARFFGFWNAARVHGVKPTAKASFDKFNPMQPDYKELMRSLNALHEKWDAVYGPGIKKGALTPVGDKGKQNGNGGNGGNGKSGSGPSNGSGNGTGGTGDGGFDFNPSEWVNGLAG